MANPKDLVGAKKPNLSIIPLAPLYEVCVAFVEGAAKYGRNNWRDQNVSETIYVDAAIRHLNQWLSGETIDPDSGLSHVTKAIAGLIILRDAQIHGCSIDDRGPVQNLDIEGTMEKLKAISEKYDPVALPPSDPRYEDVFTQCGGGTFVLEYGECNGCEVTLRSGKKGRISRRRGIGIWEVAFNIIQNGELESGVHLTCTRQGQATSELRGHNPEEYRVDLSTSTDIMSVRVPSTKPASERGVAFTNCGGGDLVLKYGEFTGHEVTLRNGEKSWIKDTRGPGSWEIGYDLFENGVAIDDLSCNCHGQSSSLANSEGEFDPGCTDVHDIISVKL